MEFKSIEHAIWVEGYCDKVIHQLISGQSSCMSMESRYKIKGKIQYHTEVRNEAIKYLGLEVE